jgi:hypothetical protein
MQLYDWPWYRCRFPSPLAFEPLFDQELKLLEGKGADEEWFAAYENIEGLALTLRYPSQAKSTDLFLLHIDGEMARFQAVFD